MTNSKFSALFGAPARGFDDALTQREMDLAASVQQIVEEIVLKISQSIRTETALKNLCLAGGVALNCVANGVLHRANIFDEIWIQPASGDSGGAVGAALAVHHMGLDAERQVTGSQDLMHGSLLGPNYSQSEITKRLTAAGAVFEELSDEELIIQTAQALTNGKSVGWHQGRMEFGPRALGSRSILADPRSPTVQRRLNLQVKKRESFRPFAPSVLREDVEQWFDLAVDSPYMLLVSSVAAGKLLAANPSDLEKTGIERLEVQRSVIPAVTHVDNSARIHTVSKDINPRFHDLISEFKKLTGCPVLVNTSFNVRGEPIVESPEDALRCFMRTDIEILVVGNCFLTKANQPPHLVDTTTFALD